MTKENKRRPYGQNKKPKTIRLTPEAIRRLGLATGKTGMSESAYIEMALRAQFRKDEIESTTAS